MSWHELIAEPTVTAVCTACGHPVDLHTGPDGMCRAPDQPPGVTCKCTRPRTREAA